MNRYGIFIRVLLIFLPLSNTIASSYGGINPAKDNVFPISACGPMSAYLALRAIGYECSLKELISRCEYQGEPVEVKKVYNALNSFEGIKCSIKTYNRDELLTQLKKDKCAAILLINRKSKVINHLTTVCFKNNKLILLEYPFIKAIYEELITPNIWKGDCLIVQFKSRFVPQTTYIYFFIAILCCFFLGVLSKRYLTKHYHFSILVALVVVSCGFNNIAFGDTVINVSQREPHIIDLGIIEDVNNIQDIYIKNDTKKTVTISSVSVSCSSCIKPVSTPETILSGKKGLLKFNLINKRKGVMRSRAIVETKEAGKILIVFKSIVPNIWIYPQIEFGSIKKGQSPQKTFFVLSLVYPNAKVLDVNSPSECTAYKIRKPKKNETFDLPDNTDCIGVLDLSLNSSKLGTGSFTKEIILKTNIQQFSKLNIPIKGEVEGDFRAYPKKLVFFEHGNKKEILRKCQVVLYDVKTLKINEIKIIPSHHNIMAKIESISNMNQGKIKLNITVALKADVVEVEDISYKGEVTTFHKGEILFKIPYNIFVFQ